MPEAAPPTEVVTGAPFGDSTRPPLDLVPADQPAEPLTHNQFNAATGGIWRVNRAGRPAILKIANPVREPAFPHWATSDDPGHWNYWRREVLAYRTGLASVAYAEGGIRAPELLGTTERPDGSVALWLADVPGRTGPGCRLDDIGDLARRLGVAHAARLADPLPPGWPADPLPPGWPADGRPEGRPADGGPPGWLARDWLRDYTISRPVTEPVPWDHPVAVRAWPAELRRGLRRLWDRRYDVLATTDALPRTLNHHDVWPMNLVVADTGPVLLDWSCVGPGPIGEDAANLILDTFFDGLADIALLDDVVEAVTGGYLDGLGGAVGADDVRRSIALTGAAKYFWLAPRMLNLTTVDLPRGYDQRDETEMFIGRRPLFARLTEWLAAALDNPR